MIREMDTRKLVTFLIVKKHFTRLDHKILGSYISYYKFGSMMLPPNIILHLKKQPARAIF